MGTREEFLALLKGEMESGDSYGEVAKRLGVQKQTLWSWMHIYIKVERYLRAATWLS